MTGLPQLKWQVYHSFFRPQPDSYTALRFRGLVTPVAALHPFARESGWRAASRNTPAARGALLRLPFAARNCRNGGLEWLSADQADRSDHAFPAAGEFRRSRRCTRCAHRTNDDVLPRIVVECDRPASGRNGGGRVCHVASSVVRSVRVPGMVGGLCVFTALVAGRGPAAPPP